MRKYCVLLFFTFSFFLSGCLSPVSPPDSPAYLIKTVPDDVTVRRQQNATILVLQPNTAPLYNTRDMAYSKTPFQISYYAKNSWAEAPADMLLPLITKTLQKTHHFKAVVNSPYSGRYTYLLSTEITELLQDFTSCKPVLKFSMRAQLINNNGQLIAVKEISKTVPMRKEDPYAGVLAANQAVAEALSELARFVVR